MPAELASYHVLDHALANGMTVLSIAMGSFLPE